MLKILKNMPIVGISLVLLAVGGCATTNQAPNITENKTEAVDTKKLRNLLSKGSIAGKGERYEEALNYFKRAEQIQPNSEEVLRLISITLNKLEQIEESVPYLLKLADVNPFNYQTYGRLALAYRDLYEFEKSIAAFKKVLDLKKGEKQSIANLADIYFRIKDYKNSGKYDGKTRQIPYSS